MHDARSTDPFEPAAGPIFAAFRTSPDALAVVRADDGRVIAASHAWCDAVGRPLSAVLGAPWPVRDLWASPEDEARFVAALDTLHRAAATSGPGTTPTVSATWQVAQPGGGRTPRRVLVRAERVVVDGTSYFVVRGRELPPVNATALAEAGIQGGDPEARRLEELGRLAAGVAHDFNNLLTVVQAYAQLVEADAVEGLPARAEDVAEIRRAAGRAADLTRRLLTFSREQVIERRAVDLNAALRASVGLLKPLLDAVELVLDLGDELPPIFADPTQLDQLVLNLAVNARDAMPDGGRLTLRTRMRALGADEATTVVAPEAVPGEYAVLEVADTGRGMDAATAARAFDPFFTTKGAGRGTGLGLAVVHGIVRQSAGVVRLASTPGVGTVVTVFWPCVVTALIAGAVAGPVSADAVGPAPSAPRASGRPSADAASVPDGTSDARRVHRRAGEAGAHVLVVEDEGPVRTALTRMLTEAGYLVSEAAHGTDALARLDAAGRDATARPFDLVLSDVAMPTMGGRELAERIFADDPTLPVVLMSGYSSMADIRAGLPNIRGPVLAKPFERGDLLRYIATALRAPRGDHLDVRGP